MWPEFRVIHHTLRLFNPLPPGLKLKELPRPLLSLSSHRIPGALLPFVWITFFALTFTFDAMSYEKTGEPQPPRPKNSFFIFRQEWYSEQKRTNQPGILQCEFSKEAADIWKNAPQSFRDPYIQKAKLEKEEHQRRYPDYKYHPKSKMKKEQERAQAREQAKSRKRPKKTASISQPLVVASTTSTALPPPCDDFFTSGIPPAGPMGTVVPRWNDPRPIQHFRSSTSPILDSRCHPMSNISSPLSDLVSSDSSEFPSATARFVRNFNSDYDYTTRFDGSPSFVTQVERNETPARSQLYANAETSGTSTAGVLPSSSYTPSPWEYTPQESGDIFQAGNSSHQVRLIYILDSNISWLALSTLSFSIVTNEY